MLLPSRRWLGRLVTAGALGASWPQPRMGLGEEGSVLPACFFPQETEKVGQIRTLASIGQKDVLKKSNRKTKWYLRVHRRRTCSQLRATDGHGAPSPAAPPPPAYPGALQRDPAAQPAGRRPEPDANPVPWPLV